MVAPARLYTPVPPTVSYPLECDTAEMPPPTAPSAASSVEYDNKNGVCRERPKPAVLPAPGAKRPCVKMIASEAEAKKIFAELSKMTSVGQDGTLAPVPYTYPTDGCYARAHWMAQRISDLGFSVRKVFSEGNLKVPSGYAEDAPASRAGQVHWGWHVAPTLQVAGKDGKIRTMVMDPSLATGPITVEQWNALMGGNGTITHANSNAYYPRDAHSPAKPTPNASAAADARSIPTLTRYAEKAPAHELAARVRTILAEKTGSCDDRINRARAEIARAPEAVRTIFANEYPELSKLVACPATAS